MLFIKERFVPSNIFGYLYKGKSKNRVNVQIFHESYFDDKIYVVVETSVYSNGTKHIYKSSVPFNHNVFSYIHLNHISYPKF